MHANQGIKSVRSDDSMVKANEDTVCENNLVVSVRTLILNLHSYDALLSYLRIHLRVLVRSRAMGCRKIRNSLSGSN